MRSLLACRNSVVAHRVYAVIVYESCLVGTCIPLPTRRARAVLCMRYILEYVMSNRLFLGTMLFKIRFLASECRIVS
jgi:hypothetical protein